MKTSEILSLKLALLAGITGILPEGVITGSALMAVAAGSMPAVAQEAASETDALAKVLHTMDETAASFRAAEANFVWTTYNSVINDVAEKDTGKIHFRRTSKGTEMAAEVAPPAAKQIVFSDGKIQVYMPETRQEDVYDAGSHREEFETFLVLGFGSSGNEMRKSFDIKYQGTERIGNKDTVKLELTPLSAKVKAQFPRIDLWIDTEHGLAVKQQLWETGGDYRVADYSDVQLKQKIADSVFKLKTAGNVKVVNH
jgi:outer membrane lipoprotein-sorting protein